MITIHNDEQGSDGWHKKRHGLYTGTSAHKVLKYGAIEYSRTEQSDFKGNFHTKRGHILEDEAIELYQQIRKTVVDRVGFVTNSKYPQCGFSPDGLLGNTLIEVKCFNDKKHMQLFNGELPLEVQAQVHFGMMVCEKPLAHLLIYNPELEPRQAFKIIPIKANRNIQNNFKRILNREVAYAV